MNYFWLTLKLGLHKIINGLGPVNCLLDFFFKALALSASYSRVFFNKSIRIHWDSKIHELTIKISKMKAQETNNSIYKLGNKIWRKLHNSHQVKLYAKQTYRRTQRLTSPLKSLAASLKSLSLVSKSLSVFLTKSRMWFFTSPPKIFWAL